MSNRYCHECLFCCYNVSRHIQSNNRNKFYKCHYKLLPFPLSFGHYYDRSSPKETNSGEKGLKNSNLLHAVRLFIQSLMEVPFLALPDFDTCA